MQIDTTILALLGPIGTPELVIIAVLGLLIFGRKLPEVGRSVGKAIVEFKRGLTEVKTEVDKSGSEPTIGTDSHPTPTAGQSSAPAAGKNQTGTPSA